MPRVIHFEINADNPQRAVKFYKEVFGWEMTKWEGQEEYWLISTGKEDEPGINGAIMHRFMPEATSVNTIGVENLDEYIAKVKTQGGSIVRPKEKIPGVGYFVYCRDTENNLFGIIQEDENVK